MFYLCSTPYGYTQLNLSWQEVLNLGVSERDWLIRTLQEVRSKEEQEMKKSIRGGR